MSSRPVVLITGARKGIGKDLAERFLARGYDVVGCSRGEATLVAEGYHHVQGDVGVEADAQRVVRFVREKLGRLDVLLNNAGIASMNHALLTPLSVVENIVRTNFLGTFAFTREAAKLMMGRKYGRIINFSTVAVAMHLEGEAAYAASKAAVESLTRTLAVELGPYGITVNAVGPSPLETDLIKNVPRDKIDKLVRRLAIHRLATLDDVAHVVEFFTSERASYVTGQVVYLGGP